MENVCSEKKETLDLKPCEDIKDQPWKSQHHDNSTDLEVTNKYEELLVDVDLAQSEKEVMRSYSSEKKQLLVTQYKEVSEEQRDEEHSPQHYIHTLQQLFTTSTLDYAQLLECMESLRIALRCYTLTWVHDFGIGGLEMIVSILELAFERNEEKLQIVCLKCIRKYINNDRGLEEFSNLKSAHKIVAHGLNFKQEQAMIKAIQILTALFQLSPTKALLAISKSNDDENHPQLMTIVEGITMTNNRKLWASCLHFINCILTQKNNSEFKIKLFENALNGILNKQDDLESQQLEIQELFRTFKNMIGK